MTGMTRTPEQRRAIRKAWELANRDGLLAYMRKYARDNPEKMRKYAREWRRRKRNSDPVARLKNRLRVRLAKSLKHGLVKPESTLQLVGCSAEQLVAYLEAKFEPGMAWGPAVHVDHIRPVASFDFNDPDQIRACFHFSNLRPMWAGANRAKGASYAVPDV